jgi:glutathione synthase/RimK-type ligase-like ATP-grasp enzyme
MASEVTKRIGLLVGRERSFPDALIAEINTRDSGVVADYVRIGHTTIHDENRYAVIVDRISHEVSYYQTFLKRAALLGTEIVNNPFWRIADDKFFGTALAAALGIAVPRTVALPNKDYPEGIVADSLGNLVYPLDWDAAVAYTGLPAYLKPHWGGGWREVHRVASLDELIHAYDATGGLCMILQEAIEWQQYVRCIVIGKTEVLAVPWDPRKSHFERYVSATGMRLEQSLERRVVDEARRLNEALGYDMNTVEFAIRDGVPYAIDFMNSAPDFDITSLGEDYFAWTVRTMADFVISLALRPRSASRYRWDSLLAGTDVAGAMRNESGRL